MRRTFAGFELDLEGATLRKDGRVITLCPQPFRALTLLVERAGELVTREELREALWGSQTHVDYERGLNTCIRQIRLGLDQADDGDLIETVPRRGYRLRASVTTLPDPVPTSRPSKDTVALPFSWSVKRAFAIASSLLVVLSLGGGSRERQAMPEEFGRRAYEQAAAAQLRPLSDAEVLYLRGRALFERGARPVAIGSNNAEAALALFHRAATLDSRFSLPHVGLARAYLSLAFSDPSTRETSIARAHREIKRALSLDPYSSEAHLVSAELRFRFSHEWREAEHDYLRAIQLEPKNPLARRRYAMFLRILGRVNDSLRQIQTAGSLDPLDVSIWWQKVAILSYAGHYDDCVAQARQNFELDASPRSGFVYLGRCLEGQGNTVAAIDAYRRAGIPSPDRRYVSKEGAELPVVFAALEKRPLVDNEDDSGADSTVFFKLDDALKTDKWIRDVAADGASLGRLRLSVSDPLYNDPRLVKAIGSIAVP
jgi:DNA-binding winged helix-turn-helix (wHTH) protein/Tfp pilus assembly protein PilF